MKHIEHSNFYITIILREWGRNSASRSVTLRFRSWETRVTLTWGFLGYRERKREDWFNQRHSSELEENSKGESHNSSRIVGHRVKTKFTSAAARYITRQFSGDKSPRVFLLYFRTCHVRRATRPKDRENRFSTFSDRTSLFRSRARASPIIILNGPECLRSLGWERRTRFPFAFGSYSLRSSPPPLKWCVTFALPVDLSSRFLPKSGGKFENLKNEFSSTSKFYSARYVTTWIWKNLVSKVRCPYLTLNHPKWTKFEFMYNFKYIYIHVIDEYLSLDILGIFYFIITVNVHKNTRKSSKFQRLWPYLSFDVIFYFLQIIKKKKKEKREISNWWSFSVKFFDLICYSAVYFFFCFLIKIFMMHQMSRSQTFNFNICHLTINHLSVIIYPLL